MMGKDCERIFSSINNVKDVLISSIKGLSSEINYQIITDGSHGEHGIELVGYERTKGSVSSYVSPVTSAYASFQDVGKMKSLGALNFAGTSSYNNSYGSPWKELEVLDNAINDVKSFNVGSGKYIGGKIELLGLLNIALSCTVDAKYALLMYNDGVQQGYDREYNNNTPSITQKMTIDITSTGNIKQPYDENVNIEYETDHAIF